MKKVLTYDGPFTEEKMYDHFGVDKDRWTAEKRVPNVWTTTMKGEEGPVQVLNQQSKLFLKRKYPEEYDTIVDVFDKILRGSPPKFTKKTYPQLSDNLGQVLLADAHIDRLDTKYTSPKTRKRRILEATNRLLELLDKFTPQQLLFVNLGDFFNTAINKKTERGTDQQNNLHEIDAWKFGIELQAEMLQLLSEYGPVDAKFIQGNHDGEKVAHLQSVMKYYFQNNDNITIDDNVDMHQFYNWGQNRFGYDHGHRGKNKDLPKLLTADKKRSQKNLEWFRGHLHHRKMEEINDVLIHTLNAGVDDSVREKNSGYRGQGPSITGFIHSKKKGRIAEITQSV